MQSVSPGLIMTGVTALVLLGNSGPRESSSLHLSGFSHCGLVTDMSPIACFLFDVKLFPVV